MEPIYAPYLSYENTICIIFRFDGFVDTTNLKQKKKKRRENLANRIIFAVLKMNRMKTKIFVKVSVII